MQGILWMWRTLSIEPSLTLLLERNRRRLSFLWSKGAGKVRDSPSDTKQDVGCFDGRYVRKITFPPVTTTKVRVMVNRALGSFSQIVELEVWGGG